MYHARSDQFALGCLGPNCASGGRAEAGRPEAGSGGRQAGVSCPRHPRSPWRLPGPLPQDRSAAPARDHLISKINYLVAKLAKFAKNEIKQPLTDSFSAVSMPNFAKKYSLESS